MSTIFTASGGHILAEVSIDPACISGAGFAEMPMLTASLQMLLRSHKQLNATFHFREMLCRLSACNSGYVAFSLPTPINVRIGPGKELPNHVIYLEIPLDQRRIATINRLRKGGDVDLQFHLELVADELVELRLAANAPSAFGLRDQHRMRAQVNVQIPRSRWAEYVLSQLQFGKVHVIELPVVPIEKCAEMSVAFSALQQAYKLEGQGFYVEAVAACRKALEPFFDRVTASDGKKSFALKASWETRLGKATYDWLNASLIAAKQATDGSHHISSTSFDQTETQMLLAIATSLVAYAVKTRPDTSSS